MRKLSSIIITVFMLAWSCVPAFAATYYANTSIYIYLDAGDNNVPFTGGYHWAQSYPPITSITIVNNSFSTNCNVRIDWHDSSNNVIGSSNVSSNGSNTVSGPAGNRGFTIYGSCSDATTPSPQPWSYIHSETDSQGNILIFDAPSAPSGGDSGSPVDLSPITDALQVISGRLNNVVATINSQTSTIGGKIDTMSGKLDTIRGRLDSVLGKLDSVLGRLDTIKGKLDDIDTSIRTIYNYISTPRTSQPLTTSLPTVNFSPTPPPVTEPYQNPYVYDRPSPQMPPFVGSPGPLPSSPDPWVMEHDPAAEIEQPKQIEQVPKDEPRVPDPTNMDPPANLDPVNMDTPVVQDPVNVDTPVAQDPVSIEAPKIRDPVNMDTPIQAEQPKGKDNPLSPAPPLIPDPPRQVDM